MSLPSDEFRFYDAPNFYGAQTGIVDTCMNSKTKDSIHVESELLITGTKILKRQEQSEKHV